MKIYLAEVEHSPENTICAYSFSGRQLAIDKNNLQTSNYCGFRRF